MEYGVIMTSSRHFEGDIMLSTGYGSLFSDKACTTIVFMSFGMSAFIFVVLDSFSLRDENFRTLLAETEGIINSRPLRVETLSDVNIQIPLSPSNLLT